MVRSVESEHGMVAEIRQPIRWWTALGAVVVVVGLSVGLAAPAGAAARPTLTIDQRRGAYGLDDVVGRVHQACVAQPDADLAVTVRQPTYELSVDVVCSAALSDAGKFVQRPLVEAASRHGDVGARADAVGDVYDALPPVEGVAYDRDETVWSIASFDPARCRTAETRSKIRDNLNSSVQARDTGESPAHWTLVEALWAMSNCPGRLHALYRNVAALGNPIAAQTVEQILERAPVTLPLSSIPQGVSARTVAGRTVFLERDGDRVTTFLTDVHHLPGEHTLWYCPEQHVFAAPTHAETFDEAGAIVGGPAQRGLDRFATTVEDGTVTVHLRDIVRGGTDHSRSSSAAAAAAAAAAAGVAWNTDPRTFCFQPVTNDITPFG
jgi:hypothetical protein